MANREFIVIIKMTDIYLKDREITLFEMYFQTLDVILQAEIIKINCFLFFHYKKHRICLLVSI